jgi:hypothetical protein
MHDAICHTAARFRHDASARCFVAHREYRHCLGVELAGEATHKACRHFGGEQQHNKQSARFSSTQSMCAPALKSISTMPTPRASHVTASTSGGGLNSRGKIANSIDFD